MNITHVRSTLALLTLAALSATSRAQTIDSLVEGNAGTAVPLSFVTLQDLDQGLGTAPNDFHVDDASGALLNWDVGNFPQNKVVTFGGHVPGPDNLYGRCKSFRMVFSQPLPAVYFTMWFSRASFGNSVQFDFRTSGQTTLSGSLPIPAGTAPFCLRMNPTPPGGFDEIVVTGIGPIDNGVFHGVIDGFLFGAIVDFAPTCDGGMNSGHTPCPCGNDSNVFDSEGCNQSFGYGTRMRLSGNSSLSNDTLRFVCMQLPPNSSALFFQGAQMVANFAGTVFGDGLRCAGGTIVRLATKQAGADGLAYYPEAGDAPVSVKGQITTVNSIRTYQVWSRNAQSFCTPATFNLSNGFAVGWGN
jgi:hypothetical protein